MSDPSPVPSPCIRMCVLDAQGRYCTGCQRTPDEIERWSEISDAERRAILARAQERRRSR